MKLKLIAATVATALVTSSAAVADVQDVVNSAVSDLTAQGYTRFQVQEGMRGIKIEGTGPSGKIERVYNSVGELLKEEVGGRHTGLRGTSAGRGDDDQSRGRGDDDQRRGRGDDDDHRGRGSSDHDRDNDHGRGGRSSDNGDHDRGGDDD